ncbi:MAG: hypothetical protein RL758_310 [Pseudomonadota bacterium]
MDHLHPIMQQALGAFGANMNRQFTVNPAFPHPDNNGETEPWPLGDAIAYALKVLKDPNATQHAKNFAATELDLAWCNHEE